MKHYIQTTAFAAMLLLAACGEDNLTPGNLPEGTDPDAPIKFTTKSTAGGDGEEETVFQDGAEIGIYVGGHEDYQNLRYVYQSDGAGGRFVPATPQDGIYYGMLEVGDIMRATYTAYYPYDEQGDYANPTIEQDQSTAESYYVSDALVATGALGQPMTFSHRMAKVLIRTDRDVTAVSLEDQGIKLFNDGDNRTWRGILQPGTQNLKAVITQGSMNYEVDYGEVTLTAGSQREFTIRGWMAADGSIIIDLSQESVTIDKEGKYYITLSESGTTSNNITVDIPAGTTAEVKLLGVDISAGTAFEVVHGTAEIELLSDGTSLVSTGEGQPGISLTNADAHVHIIGGGHTLYARGGPSNTYIPGGPAIGVACDGTGGNITIENCRLTGDAGQVHAAAIGTCADVPSWQNVRTSTCGNITISDSYLELAVSDGSDHIGNGTVGDLSYGRQYCNCGSITLTRVELDPADMRIGQLSGEYYECGTVTIDGVVQN